MIAIHHGVTLGTEDVKRTLSVIKSLPAYSDVKPTCTRGQCTR